MSTAQLWAPSVTCYACNATWSTKEHVPPKVFFPEKKDTDGDRNLREDLVTVPACREHNNDTSDDDEYTWNLVAARGTNAIANRAFDKVARDWSRRVGRARAVMRELHEATMRDTDGTIETSVAFSIEFARVARTMRKIAAALWYQRSGHRLKLRTSDLHVFSPAFFNASLGRAPHEMLPRLFDSACGSRYIEADTPHPDVFFYDIAILDRASTLVAFRFFFYEGVRFDVVSEPLVRLIAPAALWTDRRRKRARSKLAALNAARRLRGL